MDDAAADRWVASLNRLIEVDPGLAELLIQQGYPCDPSVAEDPLVGPWVYTPEECGRFEVRFLGLLNAHLGATPGGEGTLYAQVERADSPTHPGRVHWFGRIGDERWDPKPRE